MATIKKIKKAQSGKNVPKGMVESEMNPGKMIPKSKSNYYNGEYSKMVEAGKPKASAPKPKGMNFDKKSFDKLPKIKSKAKNGKSFPDLNKDGKVTKADILKGRGVIAKKGAKVAKSSGMAKCKYGCK
jgi:hypothetical protein